MQQSHSIEWIDGQPFSNQFGDIFFSRSSGLEESRHVFLRGNNLAARWRTLESERTFVIGETGFGTGLNFLAAWQLWNELKPAGRMHFFSFERFPLSAESLQQAHALWPELAALSTSLLEQYTAFSPGWHRLIFQSGQINLTLVIGDASICMKNFEGSADAWFLDGFSPARNPEMWTGELLEMIARHSSKNASLATFTSAGAVRRGLQAVGFEVEKQQGFGHKREMLVGNASDMIGSPAAVEKERSAIVIGAGLAGCATSRSLAEKGWRVTLLERGTALGANASGLPQATLNPRLPKNLHASHQLALLGYQFSIGRMRGLAGFAKDSWQQCGTLQLDHASRRIADESQLGRLSLPESLARRVAVGEASDIAGVAVSSGGTFYSRGGWVNGEQLCRQLLNHPMIETQFGSSVSDVVRSTQDMRWRIHLADERLIEAGTCVVTNAYDASALAILSKLPLHRIGGQLTFVPATTASEKLRTVLCGEGVITPASNGVHSIGATYNHNRQDEQLSEAEHEENLAMLRRLTPNLFQQIDTRSTLLHGRVSFRATTPDRAPIAGDLPDTSGTPLILNLGHGSRGFSTAPLLGENIASRLAHEPAPIPNDLAAAVAPGRYAHRLGLS